MKKKIDNVANIIISNLLDEFIHATHSVNDKNPNEKITKRLKAYNRLRRKNKTCKKFF